MSDLKSIIEQSFIQYTGAVLQSRALVDVRDGLKPSARQIFYSMLLHKLVNEKPYKKTANAVGMAMADFYIHGDSSCEGIIMRAGQPFAMRYPLVEVKGNAGTLIESGNWAAMRYTESRLSKVSNLLFKDIDKDTIEEWRDSYDNTKQYPSVLPSKGFYNIVNGTQGIGIGMASSIPQYNIRELNEALIHLIDNPNCSFEEIYCAPDFATGAILYNEEEVKESMKNGTGSACKLRSVVDYDAEERCFIVTEIPYGVYTNTICGQLEEIVNSENNPGIERFNDLTGSAPLIKIYLNKKANPNTVLKYLYKETSLQSYFGINFTALDKGRFPRVFTWKEMLQSHIDHEIEVYKRGFYFDLNKINDRLHIIEGLLKAINDIDNTIKIIKNSNSTKEASIALQKYLLIDEVQAKAILDIKLARIAHLEINKLLSEQEDLFIKKNKIESILSNKELLLEEIKKGLKEVANKFGDSRRTKIMNLEINQENQEPIEKKELIVYLTNFGNLYTSESTTLMTQKRGGRGVKIKLEKKEYIIDTVSDTNTSNCLAFSNIGKVYSLNLNDLPLNQKINIFEILNIKEDEKITNLVSYDKVNKHNYILFVTKNGLVKKTSLEEYKIKKSNGVIAIKLREGDSLRRVLLLDSPEIGILTKYGNYLMIDTETINPTGRATSGVIGIKLSENDEVVDAKMIPKDTKEIITISSNGIIKRTSYNDFSLGNRATKGNIVQKLKENDSMASFNLLNNNDKEVIIVSNESIIKIPIKDVQLSNKNTQGTISKKMKSNEYVIEVLK